MPKSLQAEDLDRAAQAFAAGVAPGGAWDEFRGSFFALPPSFNQGLDPLSPAYAAQQDQLWQLMSGRRGAYEPLRHEQTPDAARIDPLIRPGFYQMDPASAGEHLIALGHFVKLSGVSAGQRVLEYGAGFGQIALAFARLGALVDTVDISPDFCNAVTAQAKWFNVALTAHNEQFGYNPHPGDTYKLIIFYESFHHAREFLPLIERLHAMLADDGKILLAGEPIAQAGSPEIPYPWGMRLDAEASTVVRIRGWYEIGFQEDFLLDCFRRAGFTARKHPGVISGLATTYEFTKRSASPGPGAWPLPPVDERTWHDAEPNGRWTTGHSTYHFEGPTCGTAVLVRAINFHARAMDVTFTCGDQAARVLFQPGERQTVRLEGRAAARLDITMKPLVPSSYGHPDGRSLGIFVESLALV